MKASHKSATFIIGSGVSAFTGVGFSVRSYIFHRFVGLGAISDQSAFVSSSSSASVPVDQDWKLIGFIRDTIAVLAIVLLLALETYIMS